jgi:Cys-tRNA(Pro)/Cys-tRNA(Cys) deacylase
MTGKGTPATTAARRAGITVTVHDLGRLEGEGGFGIEAAVTLGVAPERVFKTLVVSADGALGVAIVAVAGEADLKAVAAALGAKRAALADRAEAERATGYVIGGISPLGQRRRLATVLDAGALSFDTVFVSGGRRGLELELAPGDLVAATGAVVAPIASREA